MIPNIFFMSMPPDPNDSKSDKSSTNNLFGLAKMLIAKSNLTRGQMFYLIFFIVYLCFIATVAISPTIVYSLAIVGGRDLSEIKPPIPINNLLTGLYIVIGLGILYFALYALPEVRDRWNTKKKSNN